jgi:hypothetical protein
MGGRSKVDRRAPPPEFTAAEVAFLQWQSVIGRLEQCEAGAEKVAALCRSLLGELRPLSFAPPALKLEMRNRSAPTELAEPA